MASRLTAVTLGLLFAGEPVAAATLQEARSAAIVWLERNQVTAEGMQEPGGYWGSGLERPVVTAEALLALVKANRGQGAAARKAIAWLQASRPTAVDHRARKLRALDAAGIEMTAAGTTLVNEAATGSGFGLTGSLAPTSYDTALGYGSVKEVGGSVGSAVTFRNVLVARRRFDNGWAGDGMPQAVGASDKTVTAEIVRAMLGDPDADNPGMTSHIVDSIAFLHGLAGEVQAASTLELAARLAALHKVTHPPYPAGQTDALIEDELLLRATTTGAWGNDPLVNALGLLALATKPGAPPFGGATADDDFDGVINEDDPFPQDPALRGDQDGDGIGDEIDLDRDGDGVLNADEPAFATDPSEHVDTNGDGTGDAADDDDDGDGVPDQIELERGTDPLLADSDGDQDGDGTDLCPLSASAEDDDMDGVCGPADCDDANPFEALDSDNDLVCDGPDPDDDNDLFSDADELAFGSDPRNAASMPPDLSQVPTGDWDGDGLANNFELALQSSAFRKDTDNDGALDHYESEVLGLPAVLSAALVPPAVVATVSSFSPAQAAVVSAGPLRATNAGAQATPIASLQAQGALPSGGSIVLHPGILPQVGLGGDHDGDGLKGLQEIAQKTSPTNVDTDGDRFADGAGGQVDLDRYPSGRDLDGDGFVDGEAGLGTDPASYADRAGRPGDVAPFGTPDGRLDARDAVLGARIALDPGLTGTLPNPAQTQIANEAADASQNGSIDAADAVLIQQMVIAE